MTPGMMNEIREVVAEESDSSEFGVAAVHRRELFVEVERLRSILRRIQHRVGPNTWANGSCARIYADTCEALVEPRP